MGMCDSTLRKQRAYFGGARHFIDQLLIDAVIRRNVLETAERLELSSGRSSSADPVGPADLGELLIEHS
jgi:hypothetical protein